MHVRGIVLVALLIAGCSGMPALPTLAPYKIDIQQGNFVTQEMIAKVQPGMSRSQVRFALGTPLVVDPFRADRWDYVYLYTKRGAVTEQRSVVAIFNDDKLVRIEGEGASAWPGGGAQGAKKADQPAAAVTAPPERK